MKRLEDEQREFKEFLERLRFAKDRAEFDQFMAERRQRPFEQGRRRGPTEEPPAQLSSAAPASRRVDRTGRPLPAGRPVLFRGGGAARPLAAGGSRGNS